MVLMRNDILKHIGEALDADDIVDRLGLDSIELCQLLSRQIMNNLSAFDDVYTDDVEEVEDDE